MNWRSPTSEEVLLTVATKRAASKTPDERLSAPTVVHARGSSSWWRFFIGFVSGILLMGSGWLMREAQWREYAHGSQQFGHDANASLASANAQIVTLRQTQANLAHELSILQTENPKLSKTLDQLHKQVANLQAENTALKTAEAATPTPSSSVSGASKSKP